MATTADLTGLAMPPPLATFLGYSPTTVVAAGTASTTATALGPDVGFVVLTTASSQTGVRLHASYPIGRPLFITNPTSDSAVIFPPSSGQINGGTATTGGLTLAQNKTAIFIRQTTGLWLSILTA